MTESEPEYWESVITDDFVIKNAAPSQEAKSWIHVGIDDRYHPAGGYWFPSSQEFDPDEDATGWVEDPDDLPRDEILQFPLESRQPETAGGRHPPDYVRNRVVERGGSE